MSQPSPPTSRAASCPERPCAAVSLPPASRSSEAEDDALTRALSLVKRRKRTSLACEAARGADAVRVHDLAETRQALAVWSAIEGTPAG